jgi:Pyridine nucleotide-disulphide oxidoreductase
MHLVAVGGSDAGISAALRARELDPSAEVTVVVADAYPNFSICGIPYYVSGEVTQWPNLAHRTYADLEATGMKLRLDTVATSIDVSGRRLAVREQDGSEALIDYDELVVGTGAVPVRPLIDGLDTLGVDDGVHLLHSMGDTFALTASIKRIKPKTALIVGAGYVGLEMAEGLTTRGLAVTQVEMLPEVLPTVDPELGAFVHTELDRHGVAVHTRSTITRISRAANGMAGFTSTASDQTGRPSAGTSTWCWSWSVSAQTLICCLRRVRESVPGVPWWWTNRWRPACRTFGRPATASSPTTASSASSTFRSGQRRTNKVEWPAKTPLAAQPDSPAASAPKSSKCSILSPPAPGFVNMKPWQPATPHSPARPALMITRRTIPARTPSTFASPATPTTASCSARS